MRNSRAALLVLLFSGHLVAAADAASIYRCVGADGVIRFQDQACRSNENSRRIELPDASPAEANVVPRVEAKVPPAPANVDVATQRVPESEPAVTATLCTREDGSRYLGDSGHGEQRAVPLGVLGIPRDSLAEAYGGRDGIGVSAPGLREAPVDHSRHGRIGALLAWVEDPCVQINKSQLCEFLGTRIDEAELALRLAFSDSQAQRRNELQALRQRASQCPR